MRPEVWCTCVLCNVIATESKDTSAWEHTVGFDQLEFHEGAYVLEFILLPKDTFL